MQFNKYKIKGFNVEIHKTNDGSATRYIAFWKEGPPHPTLKINQMFMTSYDPGLNKFKARFTIFKHLFQGKA